MKKRLLFLLMVFNFTIFSFAQNFVSVDMADPIYKVIDYAQLNGLCHFLSGYKPYTQDQILKSIDEILNSDLELSEKELSLLKEYKTKYTEAPQIKNNVLHFNFENKDAEGKKRASFKYNFAWETIASGGVYNEKNFSQWGIDIIPRLKFQGDIGSHFSYMLHAFFDLTRMPLAYMGEYTISKDDRFDGPKGVGERKIKKYQNMSYLPYGYNKPWDGQMYFLSNMGSDGLEGWPFELGVSGGLYSEIRASFLDNKIVVGGGRYNREIAGMDEGSSLVLNAKARPFFGLDFTASPLPWLKFTSLTGILEYPNQDYIFSNTLPVYTDYIKEPYYSSADDADYWQNAFSVNMIELDFKYMHFDFGGTCVWPKRFELGYIFPLSVFVEYQNHIGDYDNLSLFGDLKFRYPGLGEVWGSFYLDEINGIKNNPFTATRAMFALQVGLKYVVPRFDFATVSFRYSKVEPFCYTHHAVKTPWYDHPILENYSNNGESLGYYLPPNSDEFLLRFDWMPIDNMTFNTQFQFMRHGADYGSQQVQGSSMYSELHTKHRSNMRKYFLHDGAYNWIYTLSFGSTYDFNKHKVPVKLFGNLGMMYSYWTMINQDLYDENVSDHFSGAKISFDTPYKKIKSAEYPELFGGILTLGVQVSF